jgi:hypothetical protein
VLLNSAILPLPDADSALIEPMHNHGMTCLRWIQDFEEEECGQFQTKMFFAISSEFRGRLQRRWRTWEVRGERANETSALQL